LFKGEKHHGRNIFIEYQEGNYKLIFIRFYNELAQKPIGFEIITTKEIIFDIML
jgi:hypothetical protein